MLYTVTGERLAANMHGKTRGRWSTSGPAWWKRLGGRSVRSRKQGAYFFHTFVRAYVVALSSGADNVSNHKLRNACIKIMAHLDAGRGPDGRVCVDDVIRSFEDCTLQLLIDTLRLLTWSGHICSLGTLSNLKTHLSGVVKTFWQEEQREERIRDVNVCHCPFVLPFCSACCN